LEENSKRICIVSPFPPPYGGMAIQAQKLVTLLKRSGFEVISVKTNAEYPKAIACMSKIKVLRTLISLFLFLKNLHKALAKVEVVYFLTGFFNFFFWVTYPALLLIKMHRKKVILSAHGGAARLFLKKYGLLVKHILNTVDIIVTPSDFLKDIFKDVLDMEAKIVPNITDLDQFEFMERCAIRPKLLVTRSLEKIYNVKCVIKAFKIVHERFPDAVLGIVGDGTERGMLEDLVSQLGLSNCIKFFGRVAHENIQKVYDEYYIYVNASNVDNLPLTILEAFACGLPVVSTNVGGISYMIKQGETGLLVNKNDFNALAQKVIQLVEDNELALRLSKNAREECQKYSWENVNSLLLPLLYTEWDHLNL
jgi:glycosyltransferase involved in cell wall biosynthesis